MKIKNLIIGFLLITLISVIASPQTEARMVFSTDEWKTNADVFILDADDSNSSDIQLQFGQTFGKTLRWDNLNTYFVFNDNLNIEGNISLTGTVDGVDVSALANAVATHTGSISNPHQVTLEQARTQNNQIWGDIDFNHNQAVNLRLNNQTSAPSSSGTGEVYYNTDELTPYVYNGSSWDSLITKTGSLAAVQARRNTNFTLTNTNTWYDVPLPLTDIENNTGALVHNRTNTERIDIKTNGLYLVTYHLDPNDNGVTHTLNSRVMINNNLLMSGSYIVNRDYQGEHIASSPSIIANLQKDDYITLQVERTTANELINETMLNIVKLDGIKGEKGESGAASIWNWVDSDSWAIDQNNDASLIELRFWSAVTKALNFDTTNDWFNLTDRLNIGGDGNLSGIKLTTRASTLDSEQNQIEVRNSTGTSVFSVDEDGDVTARSYTATEGLTKYLFHDINGGIFRSVSRGTIANGQSPVIRLDPDDWSRMLYSFPVPDDWVSGTDLIIEAFWTPSNTNTGNVDWRFDYASIATGEIVNNTAFTTITSTQTASGTDRALTSTNSIFTIPATAINANEMINFRINRDGANVADTFTGNVNIQMIRIQYTGKKIL